MKRAIIIVLDSVGIGQLPDADQYGDIGSNTLVNLKKARPDMHLPNLCRLGLGNIDGDEISLLGKVLKPEGCFGKMAELSYGKDTTTGHWEMAGVITKKALPTFTEHGFPTSFLSNFEKDIGRKTLGNDAASGTEIIQVLGDKHVATGYPIVYTSADSVFQIAAHEDIIPLPELYKICETARAMLTGDLGVGRVIARPFIGKNGVYTRTKNRKDFSLPPTGTTILDLCVKNGMESIAVGKIEDIFAHRGITLSNHTTNNADGIDAALQYIQSPSNGLLFINLVDFDMIYGHRNDIQGYSDALMYFDQKLPLLMDAMKEDDILFITADHGCDPTTPSTDHSREYVPLLVWGKSLQSGVNLGVRSTFADLAATISQFLGFEYDFHAQSFYNMIKKDI